MTKKRALARRKPRRFNGSGEAQSAFHPCVARETHYRFWISAKEYTSMSAYQVRRVYIGTSEQLDELARECGRLYSQTVISFWRTVRHKGSWLKPKHLMRWHTSKKLHAHTADACVQAFFAAMNSWRERRKDDSDATPPISASATSG